MRTVHQLQPPPITLPGADTPGAVRDWLLSHQWKHSGYGNGDNWQFYDPFSANTTQWMTWEQAVAYEAFRFMNIGAKS
jgi:hypothetical protein